jgi:predicted site-specific integrase-resolvase
MVYRTRQAPLVGAGEVVELVGVTKKTIATWACEGDLAAIALPGGALAVPYERGSSPGWESTETAR